MRRVTDSSKTRFALPWLFSAYGRTDGRAEREAVIVIRIPQGHEHVERG